MRSMDWVRYWALLTNTNITYNDNLNGIDNPLSLSENSGEMMTSPPISKISSYTVLEFFFLKQQKMFTFTAESACGVAAKFFY